MMNKGSAEAFIVTVVSTRKKVTKFGLKKPIEVTQNHFKRNIFRAFFSANTSNVLGSSPQTPILLYFQVHLERQSIDNSFRK